MRIDELGVLIDFVALSENEIQRIETGKARGPSMRDCLGQWKATVREAKTVLKSYDTGERRLELVDNDCGNEAKNPLAN